MLFDVTVIPWVFILTGQYRWGISAVAWFSIPVTYRNSMYFLVFINTQNKSEHPGGNGRQYLSFFMHWRREQDGVFFYARSVKGTHLGVSGDSDLKKAERDVLCSELRFHEQNSMALFSVQSSTVRKSWVMLADGNQRAQVKDEQECHP